MSVRRFCESPTNLAIVHIWPRGRGASRTLEPHYVEPRGAPLLRVCVNHQQRRVLKHRTGSKDRLTLVAIDTADQVMLAILILAR